MGRSQGSVEGKSDHRVTPGDYGTVLKRYWWAMLLVVVAATAAAFAFSAAQPNRYQADAKVRYTTAYTDAPTLALELNGINSTLSSSNIQNRVASKMGRALPTGSDFTISAIPLSLTAEGEAAGPLTPTNLVAITAVAGNATLAAQIANAYTEAYVAYRTEATRLAARDSIAAIEKQLVDLQRTQASKAAPAESVTATFVSLNQQLIELKRTRDQGTGGYVVLSRAVPPAGPVSPQPVRSAILGFFAGLLLAFVLILILERFRTRVESDHELAALLSLPLLGRLLSTPGESGRLATLEAPASTVTEGYRRLRASLASVLAGDDVKTLLCTSSRGDDETSVVLANVAVTLARAGRRIVLIDADLRHPRVHECFCLPNDVGVSSVVTGRTKLHAALHTVDLALEAESAPGSVAAATKGVGASLQVLTSGPDALDPGELVAGRAMGEVVADLKRSADLVIVDSPGLLDAADASSLANLADAVVFIANVGGASRSALQECREYLDLMPCRQVGVVAIQNPRAGSRWGRLRTRPAGATAPAGGDPAARTVSITPGGPSS